jgi:hypothetical protein
MSRNAFLRALVLGTPLLSAASLLADAASPEVTEPSTAPDAGNLRTFVELARSDLRHERSLIFVENMPLTEDEAVEFWPLQRDYENGLGGLLDERYTLVVQFVRESGSMTDEQATTLANKAFDLEEKRTALKRKYFKKFCKVIPAVKAARFFQIDNQLNMALDLRVAAMLPLIK